MKKISKKQLMFMAAAVILLLLVDISAAQAFQVSRSSTGAELRWHTRNILYMVNPTGAPAGYEAPVRASMQTWNETPVADFDIHYWGVTNAGYGAAYDNMNVISFVPMGHTGQLGVNYYWYHTNTGEIIDSDIQLNTDYVFDLQNVVTHELGHSLSLADLYDPADAEKTMYGYCGPGEVKKRTLHVDDLNGIAHLYPNTATMQNVPLDLNGAWSLTRKIATVSGGSNPQVAAGLVETGSMNIMVVNNRVAIIAYEDGSYVFTPLWGNLVHYIKQRPAAGNGCSETATDEVQMIFGGNAFSGTITSTHTAGGDCARPGEVTMTIERVINGIKIGS